MSDSVHALLVLRAISVQPIAHDVMHTTWITDVDCDRNVLMTMRYAEQALRRFLDLAGATTRYDALLVFCDPAVPLLVYDAAKYAFRQIP